MGMEDGRGYDILLVEDDRDVRDAMVEALQEAGYTVQAAEDGREALRLLRERHLPRVILLDLMMPNMDGFEFRAEQKKRAEWAQIPVVVITAEGRVDEQAPAIDTAGHLPKPIKLERLLEVARAHCGPASAATF
jgi:CheY-like chemotaxis protein